MRSKQSDCDLGYSWSLLPKVSRSFALVTAYLAEDKKSKIGDSVMLFYHVCRVLDTIEDSSLPVEEKKELYSKFLGNLEKENTDFELIEDGSKLSNNKGYIELINNAGRIVSAYSGLSVYPKYTIKDHANKMAKGMLKFNSMEIKTLKDLDDYCFPVAGLVGHGLTHLFFDYNHLGDIDGKTFDLARDFGLALQKVNITRDFGDDYSNGLFFWPSDLLENHGFNYGSVVNGGSVDGKVAALQEMINYTKPNFDGAMQYLYDIPPEQEKVRMFCGVSLLLALATLEKIKDNPEVFNPKGHPSLKVERSDLYSLVDLVREKVSDNHFFKGGYETSKSKIFSDAILDSEYAR